MVQPEHQHVIGSCLSQLFELSVCACYEAYVKPIAMTSRFNYQDSFKLNSLQYIETFFHHVVLSWSYDSADSAGAT